MFPYVPTHTVCLLQELYSAPSMYSTVWKQHEKFIYFLILTQTLCLTLVKSSNLPLKKKRYSITLPTPFFSSCYLYIYFQFLYFYFYILHIFNFFFSISVTSMLELWFLPGPQDIPVTQMIMINDSKV